MLNQDPISIRILRIEGSSTYEANYNKWYKIPKIVARVVQLILEIVFMNIILKATILLLCITGAMSFVFTHPNLHMVKYFFITNSLFLG